MSKKNNNNNPIIRAHVNANQLIQQAKNNGTYAAKKAENNAMIAKSARGAFKNNVWPVAQLKLKTNNKKNNSTVKKKARKAARNVNSLKMGGRRKRKTRRHKKHKRKHRRRRTHKRKHRRRRRTRRGGVGINGFSHPKKGQASLTRIGNQDFTTKRGNLNFHENNHNVKKNRNPYTN